MSFEFDHDDTSPPARNHSRRAGHGGSAFMTMFGGSLGCVAAVGFLLCAVFVFFALVCGGCVAIGTLGKPDTKPTQKAK